MTSKLKWVTLLLIGLLVLSAFGNAAAMRTVPAIKADILSLSQSYIGQGDPNFIRQKTLDVLVAELLAVNPQPPVKARLKLLEGPWHQIWGPYDYRNDDRGVDPKITPHEIYQVVFRDGYYYNVNPIQGQDKIALLRGEYQLTPEHPDMLKVRFTNYPGNHGLPAGMAVWGLAALAEKGELPAKTTIVPTLIVRLFFGGGYLREVYTDQDMRITYSGDSVDDRSDEFIYIMTRPGAAVDRQ